MCVIYRFVYIYKFIIYRSTIYLYKITYIFVKFVNFWVVILRKRQFLSFNSSKRRELFLFLPPLWRHSIFLEYSCCREHGGIRSLRVKKTRVFAVNFHFFAKNFILYLSVLYLSVFTSSVKARIVTTNSHLFRTINKCPQTTCSKKFRDSSRRVSENRE